MEFELTEKQREWMRRDYEDARGIAEKEKIRTPPLRFFGSSIIIKKDLLKELFQQGYSAIRVKKELAKYKVFFFEIFVPLHITEAAGADLEIAAVGDVDLNSSGSSIDALLYKYLSNNKETKRVSHYMAKSFDCTVFFARVPQKINKFMLHTHSYTKERKPERLSKGDLLALSQLPVTYFLCSLSIDLDRFVQKVRRLGAECFGEDGFLKPFYEYELSKNIAREHMNPGNLKKFFENRGIFLVTYRHHTHGRSPNGASYHTMDIFTKVRIA